MYTKSSAMLRPGKIIPVIGTSMDGKYDAVIACCKFNLGFLIGLYDSSRHY